MGTTLIGFVLGLVLGAMTGTEMGAFAGAAGGMLVGASLYGYGWMRSHMGDAPTVERHRVLCTPYGHYADVDFAGDLGTKRWSDVKSCSLLDPATDVGCDKRCLHQLTLAGARPGKPCRCGA